MEFTVVDEHTLIIDQKLSHVHRFLGSGSFSGIVLVFAVSNLYESVVSLCRWVRGIVALGYRGLTLCHAVVDFAFLVLLVLVFV